VREDGLVLASALDSIRLWLHVLGATIWVGGQLTMAALVPALRAVGPDVPKRAARAFNRVAWPAFGLLVVTGIWNVAAVNNSQHPNSTYQAVLGAKVAVVAASGITAWLHARATSSTGLALWGALTGLTALSALYLGVLLSG
jgi:putative copper export protein